MQPDTVVLYNSYVPKYFIFAKYSFHHHSGRMSRCSFHAEAERDRPSSMLLKSAIGRSVIFETDTQVDPSQTAGT